MATTLNKHNHHEIYEGAKKAGNLNLKFPWPNYSRAELKPDDTNPVKMSSPATHEDLSQFLNKFPSGIDFLAIHNAFLIFTVFQ